ncbi:hypothetical protein PHYSODRAFT_306960 [Phytophthora sojae]|uniref:Uncharacterized protein n=1 Tax=Phytophthora sojae (strain P6497) TaxID=1094619 RepID=G5ABV4_PHYSP|nr:hypothetical protein PHYSODRAFT_306960 [Phytophthora sojae]EGZ06829.1 hypothetical protein PHYSODRAFT_306960 [Phytophthora sojae]|eukprot:XP_009537593.1 hypothetical protein PHYSODRAFT_306960 [Phytophthora sojae]
MPEPPPDANARYRIKGGGVQIENEATFAEMMEFCLKIPVFAKLRERTQHTRVRRFMDRYNPKTVKTAPAGAALRESAQATVAERTAVDSEAKTSEPGEESTSEPADQSGPADQGPAEGPADQSAHESRGDSVEESGSESDEVSVSSQSSAMGAGPTGTSAPQATGSGAAGYAFRRRQDPRVPVSVPVEVGGDMRPVTISVPLFAEDLTSIRAGNMVTGAVVDYCVSRFAKRTEGLVLPVLAALFSEIVFAYERRTERVRGVTEITGDMTWETFRLLVVERSPTGEMVFYHVNSVAGVHEPGYLFAELKWFFQARHSGAAGTFKNSSIAYCYIENHQPRTLMDVMRLLTIGPFNSSSAEKARESLLSQVTGNA